MTSIWTQAVLAGLSAPSATLALVLPLAVVAPDHGRGLAEASAAAPADSVGESAAAPADSLARASPEAVQPGAPSAGDALAGAARPTPRRRDVLTWPIYVRWDSDDGNQLRTFGPVSGTWRSDNRRARYLLFPATGAWTMADGRSEQWLVWPIAGRVRDPARGLSAFHLARPLGARTRLRCQL